MVIKVKRFVLVIIIIVLCLGIFLFLLSNNKTYQKTLYKTEYSEFVIKYAEEYDVDPYLVYAVIKTESNFKADAISNVGARGLMQIMPTTFDWMNSKIKCPDTTFDDMYSAEDNIRFGCFFLGYLIDEFQNYETALAAYHSGRGAVNQWLKDPEYSSDEKTLKHIPIGNTAHYVHKVMKNYNKYQEIYKLS